MNDEDIEYDENEDDAIDLGSSVVYHPHTIFDKELIILNDLTGLRLEFGDHAEERTRENEITKYHTIDTFMDKEIGSINSKIVILYFDENCYN